MHYHARTTIMQHGRTKTVITRHSSALTARAAVFGRLATLWGGSIERDGIGLRIQSVLRSNRSGLKQTFSHRDWQAETHIWPAAC
jgi:hypothetical protein